MKPNSLRSTGLAALCLLFVLPLAAAPAQARQGAKDQPQAGAAAQPAAQDEFFLETVDVTVVNVDVYVTDKKGNRITGLTRDDFEIFEDGRPVKVTNFYAVLGGKPLNVAEAAPAEAAPPGVPAASAAVAPAVPDDQRLHLIVYIDNFNIHPFNRNRVMRDLRTFLRENLKRGDQVMLVSYDRELHVRRTFTSDSEVVASALLDLETVTGSAVHHASDRRDVLQRIEDSRSAGEALLHARSYAESVFNDLSFTINALKDMVTVLAGVPGRKAILYVSDGIPMVAGQDVFHAVQEKFREQSSSLNESFQYDASRRFRELTAQANANRVTFYTIDAAGLRTYSSVSAENQTAGAGVYIDTIQIQNLQSPLQMMAEATGGVAVINANNVMPALLRIAGDFGTYYSLGYSPTHAGDGRFYKIDVKVKKKGLTVRHREGYRDKSVDSQMADGTLAALQFPYEANPLGVGLEFGRGSAREDGYYMVPVEVKIPLGKVVLVPRGATQDASVRLFIAAIDEKGDTSEVQQARVPISIPEAEVATAKDKYYVYTVNLLMRGGEHKVAVGIRDEVGSESSFVARRVQVGS